MANGIDLPDGLEIMHMGQTATGLPDSLSIDQLREILKLCEFHQKIESLHSIGVYPDYGQIQELINQEFGYVGYGERSDTAMNLIKSGDGD